MQVISTFFFFMLSVFGIALIHKIASVVEKEPEGDFLVLKREVSPHREGIIDIYSSSTDSIRGFTPLTSVDVSIGDAPNYRYRVMGIFILRCGVQSGVVSNRVIEMDKTKNFRDIGVISR